MSDWLLQGVDPREPAGQEFYLHTADEWFDIVNIVDQVCLFPLAADNPLGWLEDRECRWLAHHIDFLLARGTVVRFFKKTGSCRGVEDLTVDNLGKFSSFLKSCGGYMADVAYR